MPKIPMTNEQIENETDKFDEALVKNQRRKIIPTMHYSKLDIDFIPNDASLDDIIKPIIKKEKKMPAEISIKQINNKNKEMF